MTIADVLNRLSIPFDNSGRGKNRPGWLNCRCPKCGRWPYLGIASDHLNTTAWCCGRMSLSWALAKLSGQDESLVKTLIAEVRRPDLVPKHFAKAEGTLQLPFGIEPMLLPVHQQYLRSRRVDAVTIQRWELAGIGQFGGHLAWHIFIPVHFRGELVAWTTRRIARGEPRYWSAKPEQSRVPVENLLYGMDFVRHCAVIVEGPFDCLRIGPGAVAVLGSNLSPAQLEQLARVPVRVLAFDAEEQAQDRARQFANNLSVLPGRTVIVRPTSAKDWGAADPAEIQELRTRYLE